MRARVHADGDRRRQSARAAADNRFSPATIVIYENEIEAVGGGVLHAWCVDTHVLILGLLESVTAATAWGGLQKEAPRRSPSISAHRPDSWRQ